MPENTREFSLQTHKSSLKSNALLNQCPAFYSRLVEERRKMRSVDKQEDEDDKVRMHLLLLVF